MDTARGGAADQQRNVEPLALHFGGDMHHLVERGRDQAGQADDVDLLGLGNLEDLGCRHHDAEIDDLEVVALEHDADDVLADVVDVALHGGHQNLAGSLAFGRSHWRRWRLLLLHERQQPATACFMTRADFTTCGRNILPAPNRSPTTFMPAISGPSMTCSGRSACCRASSVSASMNSVMPLTSAWLIRLLDRPVAPGEIALLGFLAGRALEALGNVRQQPFGGGAAGLGQAVEHDVLTEPRAAPGRSIVIDGELAGIDDAHVHAGLDAVIQEHRVHRLAHRLVAAERERQVRHAARDMDMRQGLGDFSASPR
jgi:hypothetical protein